MSPTNSTVESPEKGSVDAGSLALPGEEGQGFQSLVDDPALLSLLADARPEQRQAIRSRKPFVVVSAGAGTGKTHTLARRFAWLLASDPGCRVDQILTLTFTQLAAAEMRERIRATLEQWHETLGDRLPHLRDAIERIDEAYISTIHSFALRAIREAGLSLDVDPGASLAGEPEEREFWTDFTWNLETRNADRICIGLDAEWRARVHELFSSPSFAGFADYFGTAALVKLAQEAGELHGSANLRPEELWDFDPAREALARQRIASLLTPEWRETWERWQGTVLPALGEELDAGRMKKEGQFVCAIRILRENWQGQERTEEAERAFYAELVGGALKSLPGQSKLKSVIEALLGVKLAQWRNDDRKLYAELTKALLEEPGYRTEEAAARLMLMRVAALGWASWEQARGRSGTLSFSDIIRLAGEAVAADSSYAKKFRHIMIDEFQDTDGIQEKLVSSLRDAWGGDEGRSLFVVGDIKQSIYRFRHANPRLFAAYIHRAEAGGEAGEHIPLSCSYRMSGRLMDDVNAAFGVIWERGVAEDPSVRYEPLMAPADSPWWSVRNGLAQSAPALEIVLAAASVPDDAEDVDKAGEEGEAQRKIRIGEKRRVLALALAGKLRKMIADGTPVWDKELPVGPGEEKFRPMRWGDIAVLVPSRAQYPALEEVFEEIGIPAVFGGGREYFNRGEVRDLVNLLRLLDRPEDDYALVGWMESPFSGLPPETGTTLLSTARAGGGERCELFALFAKGWPTQAAELETLRRRARVVGPSAALLLLLQAPGWLDSYKEETRGKVLANVRRCVDIVREYEATFGKGLSACADYLGRAMRGSAATEEASEAEGTDVLRVMTVHASKGLEFPVVVIMGMEGSGKRGGRGSNASVSEMLGAVAKKLPILVGERSEADEIQSETAKWHSFIQSREGLEEKARLLYVGMTRAQERLLCCGIAMRTTDGDGEEMFASTADGRGESWLDWLLRANRATGDRFPVTVVALNEGGEKNTEPSQKRARGLRPLAEGGAEPQDSRDHQTPQAPDLRLERLSASAYSLLRWCPFAYRMRYRQGRELLWEMPDGDGYGGADMGTLAHWVLSRWDLRAETLARYLRPELEKGALEEHVRALPAYLRPVYASGGARRALFGWLSAFAEGKDCAALRIAAERGVLKREISFRVPFAGSRLVGSIDVLWEDEAGTHVRDWKITPERSAPEEMYRNQIRFYALACRIAKGGGDEGEHAVDTGLFYLRPCEGEVLCGRAPAERIRDWGELEESVREALRTAVRGSFPPSREKCPGCPFSKLCAQGSV